MATQYSCEPQVLAFACKGRESSKKAEGCSDFQAGSPVPWLGFLGRLLKAGEVVALSLTFPSVFPGIWPPDKAGLGLYSQGSFSRQLHHPGSCF